MKKGCISVIQPFSGRLTVPLTNIFQLSRDRLCADVCRKPPAAEAEPVRIRYIHFPPFQGILKPLLNKRSVTAFFQYDAMTMEDGLFAYELVSHYDHIECIHSLVAVEVHVGADDTGSGLAEQP